MNQTIPKQREERREDGGAGHTDKALNTRPKKNTSARGVRNTWA